MESIRWLMTAANVDFEEKYLERRDQYEKLLEDGALLFEQVPMVEMDGMKIVQTKAILRYIAAKYKLYGKDLKEQLFIDMYVEAATELTSMILSQVFMPESEKAKQLELVKNRALNRYYPVYENALQGKNFLVGDQLSWADIQLLECILMVEEVHGDILSNFPQLQDFKERISEVPTIKKFLQPGSPKKPPADANYVSTVLKILQP